MDGGFGNLEFLKVCYSSLLDIRGQRTLMVVHRRSRGSENARSSPTPLHPSPGRGGCTPGRDILCAAHSMASSKCTRVLQEKWSISTSAFKLCRKMVPAAGIWPYFFRGTDVNSYPIMWPMRPSFVATDESTFSAIASRPSPRSPLGE